MNSSHDSDLSNRSSKKLKPFADKHDAVAEGAAAAKKAVTEEAAAAAKQAITDAAATVAKVAVVADFPIVAITSCCQ